MHLIDIIIPCFNPNVDLLEAVKRLFQQVLHEDWDYKVVLVDDASTQDIFINEVKKLYQDTVIIKLKDNKGRSGAIHYATKCSQADIFIFLDADCIPENEYVIEKHRRKISEGYDVSFGKVITEGSGFLNEYFQYVSHQRDTSVKKGSYMALTSANFSIRAKSYFDVGGFCQEYKRYGFEDRDLIATLLVKKMKLAYSCDVMVFHKDDLTLSQICMKMKDAGRYTSQIFAKKYPDYYTQMSYSKVDVDLNPHIKFLVDVFSCALPIMTKIGEGIIDMPIIPFRVKQLVVLSISALAFSHGTSLR